MCSDLSVKIHIVHLIFGHRLLFNNLLNLLNESSYTNFNTYFPGTLYPCPVGLVTYDIKYIPVQYVQYT